MSPGTLLPRWFRWTALAIFSCGLLGLTGSSWIELIRGGRLITGLPRWQHEFFASSRGIRSDEWAVQTPQARAQQLSSPRFALVNPDQGLGALQRNAYGMPILDWGLPFRPLTWPYLVPSLGSHGVQWFLREALLLLALGWLLVEFVGRAGAAEEERRQRGQAAALAALAVFLSSAMTWWISTPMIEFVLFASFAGAAAASAARATAPRERRLRLAATGYLATCAFCTFYPPVWAPMLWVLCGILLDAHWSRHRRLAPALRGAAPLLLVLAAAGVVGIAYHLPYLSLIIDTAYPGRRVAIPAGLPPWRLVDLLWPSLTTSAPVRCAQPVYLGLEDSNVCEASAIEAIPLLLLLGTALVSARVRRALLTVLRVHPATVAASAVLAAWLLLPLPGWFATVSLLRWSPAMRVWIPFSLACALLVAAVLTELRVDEREEPRSLRVLAVGAAVVAGSALAARAHLATGLLTGCVLRAWLPPMILAAVLLLVSLAWLGTRRGALWLLAAWLAPIALANFSVNPMIHTGQLFLRGVGHAAIDRALARAPGRLVDVITHPGATLSAFGWPTLTGVQVAPDLALWRFLAPESPGLTDFVYNRYAHYRFVLPPAPSRLVQGDVFEVSLSPCSPRLRALWVNHFLVTPAAVLPKECEGDFTVSEAGDLRLWSRRAPVCRFGVARGAPDSALAFDYSCGAQQEGARFEPGLQGFTIAVPPDPSRSWALALDPAVVESIECTGATARTLDAHLIIRPDGGAAASCRGRYLGSWGALRRMLRGGRSGA